MLRHVGLITVLLLYIFIGGMIFHHIECPVEKDLEQKILNETKHRREKLIDNLISAISQCQNVTKDDSCGQKMKNLILNHEVWVEDDRRRVHVHEWQKWGFWSSVFYSGALITTIGYGNVVCRTRLCQGVTIVYSIIGIPLLFIVLRLLGTGLFIMVNWIYHQGKDRLRRCMRSVATNARKMSRTDRRNASLKDSGHVSSLDSGQFSDPEENVPLSLAVFICVAYLLLVTAVYNEIESQWDYFTTLYFIFITVSTIGLGDYVPMYPKYAVVLLAILIIGLSLVSMLISVFASRFEKHYSDELGCFSTFCTDCLTGPQSSASRLSHWGRRLTSRRGRIKPTVDSNGSAEAFHEAETAPPSDESLRVRRPSIFYVHGSPEATQLRAKVTSISKQQQKDDADSITEPSNGTVQTHMLQVPPFPNGSLSMTSSPISSDRSASPYEHL